MSIFVTARSTMIVVGAAMVASTGCVVNNPAAAPPSSSAPPTLTSAATSSTQRPADSASPARPKSPAPATPSSGPGIYSFTFEGAVGTIEVPTPRTDPRLERYGDYRRLAKAPVVTYLMATVDNRSSDIINMYRIVVVTDAGQQIEATSVTDYIDTWRDAFASNASGEGGDSKNYNLGITLSNHSQFYLLPGAKGTAVLAAKSPIKSVKRVFVYPAGIFSRVEAHRVK